MGGRGEVTIASFWLQDASDQDLLAVCNELLLFKAEVTVKTTLRT